jgi:hypothetical protein
MARPIARRESPMCRSVRNSLIAMDIRPRKHASALALHPPRKLGDLPVTTATYHREPSPARLDRRASTRRQAIESLRTMIEVTESDGIAQDGLIVQTALSFHPRSDGSWVIRDDHSASYWRADQATVDLLIAVKAGWHPGLPVPESLAEHLPVETGRTEALQLAVGRLASLGLMGRSSASGGESRAVAPRSAMKRQPPPGVPLLLVPPLPRWLRPVARTAALAAPGLAAIAAAITVHTVFEGRLQLALASWIAFAGHAAKPEVVGAYVLAMLLVVCAHELGHAVALGSAIGQPVWLGLRMHRGIPLAYTDARDLLTIPDRHVRISVLLGGLAAEMTVWAVCAAVAATSATAPPLAVLIAVVGGPFAVVRNLQPFLKSDGHFVLQELTGVTYISEKGLRAAVHLADPALDSSPDDVWWLPWFGILDLYAAVVLQVMIAAFVARLTGIAALGYASGGLLMTHFAFGVRREILSLRLAASVDSKCALEG